MKPDQLRTWRINKDLTQGEMADYVGIPFSTYRNWEHGTRNPGATGTRLLQLVKRAEVFCPAILEG